MTAARPHLTQLERNGLIEPAMSAEELEYLFRHALVRDGAYQSLLKQDRQQLHLVVGQKLEELYPDRLAELAPLLAYHFAIAGDGGRALYYYSQAGDVAYGRYANAEAANLYRQALKFALPGGSNSQQLKYLYSRCGRALEMNGQYEEALVTYQEMLEVARKQGDRPLELAALVAQATLHAAPTPKLDPATAERLSVEALELASALNDPQTEAKIYWNRMLMALTNDAQVAVGHGEMSLNIARRYELQEQLAYTLNDLYRGYLSTGQPEKAWAAIQEAQSLWRQLDNKGMLADNLASTTFYYLNTGDYAPLIAAAEEAIALSETIGNLWGQSYGRYALSLTYWLTGQWGKVIPTMQACITLGEQAGFILASVEVGSLLALTYGLLGASDRAYPWANYALAKAETMPPAYRFEVLGVLSLLDCLQGKLAEADERLTGSEAGELLGYGLFINFVAQCEVNLALGRYAQALTIASSANSQISQVIMYTLSAQVYYYEGRALFGLGRLEEAVETLTQARLIAQQQQARPALLEILAALAEIEIGRGNSQATAELRRQAQAVVYFIADGLEDDLRQSYFNTQTVRLLLDN